MRFSLITAVIALFATAVMASDPMKARQTCYPSTCDCNEDGCTASSPSCCANGSCPC
ncbi:hypothetical protein K438DRAFT_1822502 [Mycena galopus ATCC 62051]|nr:hypothetical protein K438DRAFT_1822492 [Mycena galopus ATCC 62051]KAF8199783.1 hypothetical protein K438DRAFT_1822502 [Mycena galopus ATCC 62051]